MGEVILPVFMDPPRFAGDHIDIQRQCQRYDISGLAIDHGSSLFAGTSMGLGDRDLTPSFIRPLLGECGVDLFIELASGII